MMRHRPGRMILFILLSFAVPAAERPVVYMRLTDSLTMDPGKTEDFFSQEVIFNVFEGLVSLGKDAVSVEPCLAERWVSKDHGQRWIFYLRRGVKFHNGAEFNARAVVYSFARRLDGKRGEYASFGRFFPYITSVRALDEWTVEIRPFPPVLSFSVFPGRYCAAAWWLPDQWTARNSSPSAPAPMFFPNGSRAGPWSSPVLKITGRRRPSWPRSSSSASRTPGSGFRRSRTAAPTST